MRSPAEIYRRRARACQLLEEWTASETLDDYRCDGCGKKSGEKQPTPEEEVRSQSPNPGPYPYPYPWPRPHPHPAYPVCRQVEVSKCIKLSELPMVLVLTLKRYSPFGIYGKVQRPVSFGE